jgi:hypothetical protein
MRYAARIVLALGLLVLIATAASAHDVWADGSAVPSWVKKSCCGPEHVHHLKSWQVQARPDGWHVDGFPWLIPYGGELPSQDGDYWIFYQEDDLYITNLYCFFAPLPRY